MLHIREMFLRISSILPNALTSNLVSGWTIIYESILQQEFLQKVCLKCFSEKKFFSQLSNLNFPGGAYHS